MVALVFLAAIVFIFGFVFLCWAFVEFVLGPIADHFDK